MRWISTLQSTLEITRFPKENVWSLSFVPLRVLDIALRVLDKCIEESPLETTTAVDASK